VSAPELRARLRGLGLIHVSENLDDVIALATKNRMSPLELLEHATTIEEADRARRSFERRTRSSRLSRIKPMSDFDWNWPTKIDRDAVQSALALDFLEEHRNIVLVAPQGLGKTMIAQSIAHQAILAGRGVLFVTAAQVLLDLRAQDSARALERRLKYYARIPLLVLDEIGYLAFDSANADLLFQVITMRYEKKSLVLTTNLAFSDWPSIFPSATSATALIDRVVHHADVISIEGKSYRLREAEEAKRRPRRKSRS
jgi:DNA replication protein DnaC